MNPARRHLEYLANRMKGDADEATRMAQIDRQNQDWWRGFAVASLIAGRIAAIALERIMRDESDER